MGRLGLAFRCFFRVLSGKPLPEGVQTEEALPALPPSREVAQVESTQAVQLLAMLQKEGRLLDFLQEEIDAYDDAQIGAAVRNIHKGCGSVLREHVNLEPVLDRQEESSVTVEAGFNPSHIRLMGNVTGDPPFSGVLKHHGWKASRITLPPLGGDPSIIAPAEVELP